MGESTCDTLPSSVANEGDNTVSLTQGSTATPGATKQLFSPDRVLKELYIYIYIYVYARSINIILRTGAVVELQRPQGWRTREHISCHQSVGTWV